jgi:hypothetical protein
MMIFKKVTLLALLVVSLVSCAFEVDNAPVRPVEQVEVGFEIPIDATRTSLDPDGRTTRWAEGDKLAVWAKGADGGYAFENASFMLRYFSTEYDKAFFASNIATMAEGDYTYYLSYPTPVSTNGTLATYTLPAVQTGEYDGRYDVMIAEPVVEGALTTSKRVELNTIMRHQMHGIKITVPEKSSNFDNKVYGLEITFPTAVVGDMTVDVTNPYAEPVYTNTSNTITVNSDEGFAVGSDIWVFVLPGMVSGNVSYKITGLQQRSEVATYPFERNLQRGHVTPIRMAMPPFEKYTAFNFSIGENYLGEDFNFFTLYDNNGNNMGTYYRNSENRYTWEYYGEMSASTYSNTTWRLVFDSENAVVENSVNLGTIKPYFKQNIPSVNVPYLMFEDFSSFPAVSSNDAYKTSSMGEMSAVELKSGSGWTGARCGVQAGTSARIAARRETSADYPARMDSAPLSAIKSGKSVDVVVVYNYGAAQQAGGLGSKRLGQTILQGYVTTQGKINSPGSIYSLLGGSQDFSKITGVYDESNYISISSDENSGSYTNLPYTSTYSLNNVNNNVRLSWASVINHAKGTNNNTSWFYVDNVRVQIVK